MACISYCPKRAIEYGKKSLDKERYYLEELQGYGKFQLAKSNMGIEHIITDDRLEN